MICDQSRCSFHPNRMFPQPAGTRAGISAADTLAMAMPAMMTAQVARMQNWITSVITTLNMPPLTT